MKKLIIGLLSLVTSTFLAQGPTCPNNQVYVHSGSSILSQQVPLPGPAGTVMSNLPGGSGGLAVGPNFGFPAPNPTYWTTSGGTYWYYNNGGTWSNTGHSTGNGAAVNLGAGGGFLYNLVGGTGQIYVYNGTGNGTLLVTLAGFSGGGPYDVVCDMAGNFFILKNTGPQSLSMYGPNGVLKCSWSLANNPSSSAGGGFAIVGGTVYYHNGSFYAGNILPGNSTITFTAQGSIASPSDFASCPIPIPTGTVLAPQGGTLTCSITQLNLVAQVIPGGIAFSSTAVPSSSLASCNYTWSGPGIIAGQFTPTITVNQPGVYSFTTCAGSGCPSYSISASFTVVGQPSIINPVITSSGPITCTNITSQLSVTPNTATNTITWSGPGIVSGQGTATIMVNASGLYSVSLTNTVNACAGTQTIAIANTQAPLSISVTPVNPTKCSAAAAIGHTLSGATSYTWNPSTGVTQSSANVFLVNPPVTTSYTITGSTGVCTGSVITTVSVIPSPTVSVSLSTPSICAQSLNGSPFTFTASAGGATSYTWTISAPLTGAAPNNSSTYGPLSSGLASGVPQFGTITVVGANGVCSNTAQTTVLIIPNPTVSISPTSTSICQGTSHSFTANGAVSYAWNPVTGLNTSSGAVVTANPNQTTTYSVIGQAQGCYAATQSVTLTILPNPTISITPPTPTICAGSSINLTANGAGNYTWSPGGSLSTTTGPNVSAAPSADQTYTVIGSTNSCTNTAQVTVSVIIVPNLAVSATQGTICQGYQTYLSVSGASSFSWSPATGLSSTTNAFVTCSAATSTTYTVVGNNGLCTATGSIAVYIVPQPDVTISSPSAFICEGSSTQITASGAQNFNWSPSTGLSTTTGNIVSASPIVSTNYTIVGYNSLGSVTCSEVHSYSIVVIPVAQAIVSPPATICQGDVTKLTVSGGNSYTWTPSTGLSTMFGSFVNASPTVSSVYTVQSSFNGNCATSNTVYIKVNPTPVVYAGRDTTFNLDDYKFIKATGTGTLNWIEGNNIWCRICPETQIMADRTNCYVVLAENEFGCKKTDEVCVEITVDFDVYVPNAITPNGDGLNDIFYVYGHGITNVHVTIFDRWGEKLFSSADQTVGWPGTYKGTDCKSDVYVYKLDYKGLDGKIYHKTGHVTLNR
ncbi:MAG: gliding motility-associated C-terminal domain-containing protein [Bacteroidetes bacterium]|nr:gliding motility-associated C-terminal domain-containing protein [Bacteroidota bacterium]